MAFQKQPAPSKFALDFIGWRNTAFILSGGGTLLLWIWVFAIGGIQYGIDFTGGIRHIFKFNQHSTPDLLEKVREAALLADPSAQVQNIGKPEEGEVVIQVKGFELVEKATAEVNRAPLSSIDDLKSRLAPFGLFDTGFYVNLRTETDLANPRRISKAVSDYVNDATAARLNEELEKRFGKPDDALTNLNMIPTPIKLFERLRDAALLKLSEELLARMQNARTAADLAPAIAAAGLDPAKFDEKFLLRAPTLEELKTDLHDYAGRPGDLARDLGKIYPDAFSAALSPASDRIIAGKEKRGLYATIDDAAAMAEIGRADAGQVRELLRRTFYAGPYVLVKTDQVSSRIGAELRQKAVAVISLSILAMLLYIWARFEFRFGVGTVVTLLHDALAVIPLMSVLGYEYDINLIAAILTIIGYSLNDTIVVYDRIRENLSAMRGADLKDVINASIVQTLSRTIVTGITSLLAVLALFFYGGPVLEGFSLALFIGILIGTYSSIFVSSPVVYIWPTKK